MRRLSLLILLSAVVVGGAALFEPIVLLRKDRLLFHGYLGAMVFLAWITVFSGAYIVCFFVGLLSRWATRSRRSKTSSISTVRSVRCPV